MILEEINSNKNLHICLKSPEEFQHPSLLPPLIPLSLPPMPNWDPVYSIFNRPKRSEYFRHCRQLEGEYNALSDLRDKIDLKYQSLIEKCPVEQNGIDPFHFPSNLSPEFSEYNEWVDQYFHSLDHCIEMMERRFF